MTAKDYLGQVYRLDQSITSKHQQIAKLRALTQRVTASYGGEVISHSKNVTSQEDSIIRLMEAEEELHTEIDSMVDLKLRIAGIISKVQDDRYRLILEKRYLCLLTWDQIAADMTYSRRWILNMHERALEMVDKLIAEQEEQKEK